VFSYYYIFHKKRKERVLFIFQGELKKEGEYVIFKRVNDGEFPIEQYIINHK